MGRKRVWLETGSICIYGNEDSHSQPWKQEDWASRSQEPGTRACRFLVQLPAG